jgi:c-di-GMP-binding flagellar brake protein YcgR
MAHPNQRRSHRRYSVSKIASYHREGKSFLTLTMDLGLGGMKIKTPRMLSEGEQLKFKLILRNSSIWLRGKVVYSGYLPGRESVSGVQFMRLSERAHSLLKDTLAGLKGPANSSSL